MELDEIRNKLSQLPDTHPMRYCDPILVSMGLLTIDGKSNPFEDENDSNYFVVIDDNHKQMLVLQSKYPEYKFIYKEPDATSNDKKLDNSWVIDLR